MHIATCHLKSRSPYSQSAVISEKKQSKETFEDFEKRTWRQRIHVSSTGHVEIPASAISNMLMASAKMRSMKIPGEGKKTYTKIFETSVLVIDSMVLLKDGVPIRAADVQAELLFLPSDCKPGGGRRVWKYYPVITEWEGIVEVTVMNDLITEEIFREHIEEAGKYIGLGRFRPEKRGTNGRFKLIKLEWQKAQ